LTQVPETLLYSGFALLFVGISYRVGLVPFHFWIPDIAQGSPASAAAFLLGPARFIWLIKWVELLDTIFLPLLPRLAGAWQGIAILTAVVGALGALRQETYSRALGYLVVFHSGIFFYAL